YRSRSVKALPAENLRSPRQVGVFAVGKKIFVEELALDAHIFDHRPPVENSRSACAEDKFGALVLALVRFVSAALQVPRAARDVHAGAVDHRCKFRLLSRSPAQKLAANRAGPII